ncbi:MAG TPA: HAMP domain-containing sensor histidine kinase [Chitinophagaceae bacterium]
MPVRLKITLLFATIVFCILSLALTTIYLISVDKREKYIESRLTNLAITTGNFLSRKEYFRPEIISKIDSLTAISFTRKTIQAYDLSNRKIYSFNDDEADVVNLKLNKIEEVRSKKKLYSHLNEKDVVLYNYKTGVNDFVIVAAAYDIFGHENLRELFSILLITFFGGLVVTLISGYLFSRGLLKPLGLIAHEVNEISAQNLIQRIHTGKADDEMNYLARTLNKLLNRLQASFETQSRFIANASHELSTPLASISSQLEISLQRERTPQEYKVVMNSVQQDIKHLNKLTYTLLEFAKASGTNSGIEIKPIRVDEILLRISSEISRIKNGYSVLLDFDNLPDNPEKLVIPGNDELLEIALKNIILNACKYSINYHAYVSLFVKNGRIIISIMNKGAEISEDEIENIFLPFYRLQKDRATDGFGLGLPMAKRIIKMHDGEINVNSGGGETLFTVTLKNNDHKNN